MQYIDTDAVTVSRSILVFDQSLGNTMRIMLILAGGLSLFLGLFAEHNEAIHTPPDIAFPDNYAETYTNYLSLDRTMNPDQVIRLFANDVALQGPDADGKLPFGSVLVAEVYKAKKDDKGEILTSSLGRRIKGDLALIAVMQREAGWGEGYTEELSNGNWEFAAFKADGMDAGKDLNACRACHAPLTETDHLFSLDHLQN